MQCSDRRQIYVIAGGTDERYHKSLETYACMYALKFLRHFVVQNIEPQSFL